MHPRLRLFLYITFVSGFLISAPLVVLYTAGYRFNLETGRFTRTGVLSLDSSPKGATIYIDDERQRERTPAVLKNVIPGTHRVRLEKDGFSSWQKTLSVTAQETTFANKIGLFLIRDPLIVEEAPVADATVHGERERAAYAVPNASWTEIWMYSGRDGTERLLARLPGESPADLSLAWSADGTYLAIDAKTGDGRAWMLVRADDGLQTSVTETVEGAESGNWNAGLDSQYLVRTSDRLVAIDLPSGEIMDLVDADAASSTSTGTVFVEASGGRTVVARLVDGIAEPIAYIALGAYVFSPATDGMVLLHDADRRRLVLIDTLGLNEPILLNAEASLWQWNADESRLLYSDGFDLHVYDAGLHSDETLTRVSNEIVDLAWYPTADAVLYAQKNGLSAIELDPRDGRNVTSLSTGEAFQRIWVDRSGRNAYFFASINGTSGLWRRQLQR